MGQDTFVKAALNATRDGVEEVHDQFSNLFTRLNWNRSRTSELFGVEVCQSTIFRARFDLIATK